MPIRNYTTTVPAKRGISAIQDALVKHGTTGVLYKYEQGTGRIETLQFLLRIKNQDVAFSLPVHWRKFQRVLELQQVWLQLQEYDSTAVSKRWDTPVIPSSRCPCMASAQPLRIIAQAKKNETLAQY